MDQLILTNSEVAPRIIRNQREGIPLNVQIFINKDVAHNVEGYWLA